MSRFLDLTGQRFGRLVVIECSSTVPETRWLCRCDCGKTSVTSTGKLRSGWTKSCGCFKRDRSAEVNSVRMTKHGHSRTLEYRSWAGMIRRCTNPENKSYPNYGGRGITVCDRWRNSLETFLEDMGPAPSPSHTIERVDNNGDYCPENCIWATRDVQANNKRNVPLIEHCGGWRTLSDLAQASGVQKGTLRARIQRSGWDVDQAMSTPVIQYRKIVIAHNGETLTIREWSERTGLARWVIRSRLQKGWSAERTLTEPVHAENRPKRKRPS